MDAFFAALKSFFDTFGAAIFVPVVLYIIALALKVTPKKAFMSALSAGVGLMGFNLVIGSYGNIITPVINQMVTETGVNLPIFDMGWQATAIVAYSTQVGMIFLGLCLLLQIVLFLTRYTNVFQAGDLWNNYSYMAWGSVVYLFSHSMMLALLCMIVMMLYTLLCAELIQKRWSTYYKYPSCTIASLHTVGIAPYAVAMDWILNRVGLYKVNADPETFREKMGFLGDPMTLGLLLGLFIGIVGNITKLNTLAAWGSIASCGIATAAVMAVFPRISSIFAGAFTAITESSKKTAKSGAKGEWYLAVNDATGYGEAATLISGIVLMPIVLLVSFVLPGNQVLPMLDLVALPYLIQPIIAVSNGNILKAIISGAIWFSLGLYGGTMTGDLFTQIALGVNPNILGAVTGGAVMITSVCILCNPFATVLFLAFINGNPLTIGLAIAVYVACYVLMRKNRDRIHVWLENNAANPGGQATLSA